MSGSASSPVVIPALAAFAFATTPTFAQRPFALGAPVATVDEPFTRIAQIVELRDGRVLVHDVNDNKVLMVDSAFRNFRQFVRDGAGPGELQVVTRMLLLPDGNVLISDRNSVRFVEVDPAERVPLEWKWAGREACAAGTTAPVMRMRFADKNTRLYAEAPDVGKSSKGDPEISKLVAVESYSTPCLRDTVAFVPVLNVEWMTLVNGRFVVPKPKFQAEASQPFLSANQWTLASDGRVFVVESQPFRVHVFEKGKERAASNIRHEPVPVTDAMKEAWREVRRARQRVIVSPRDGPSSVTMQARPFIEPELWPRVLPPFPRDALIASADGTVWLKRSTAHNANTMYDVIGGDAKVVHTISLTPNRRVVGFSKRFVYVARTDDDGLEWLERSVLPSVQASR